jgi:dehydrogenase/reductase SDR family protein 1
VALVTGGTRGIGKGIALELGAAGALVYVTGRTMKSSDGKSGSLEETAEAIRNRGGQCVPVRVDHENADEIEALFQRIAKEQDGRLDILVNNAYKSVERLLVSTGKPFWELEPDMFDEVNNVGLRNHYYCSVYAARLMVPRKQGLIVFVSSAGGLRYLFNVAYGVGKAACDRMAADTAVELKKHNVASISLWPGAVETETIKESANGTRFRKMLEKYGKTESTEYPGRIIVHLAQNSSLMQYSGKIVTTVDYGTTYSITDTDGEYPTNIRSLSYILGQVPALSWLSGWIPSFFKIPYWLLHQASNKF